MTATLRHHLRVRDRAYKKAKKSKSETDWDAYRHLRNEVVKLLRKAKREYYEKVYKILSDKTTESKKWWTTLKNISSKNTVRVIKVFF